MKKSNKANGGKTTLKKYGKDHFKKIRAIGVAKQKERQALWDKTHAKKKTVKK